MTSIEELATETGSVSCLLCGADTYFQFSASDRLYGVMGMFGVRKCVSCGSGVTVPIVDEHELPKYYRSDYYTHTPAQGIQAVLQRFDHWRRARRNGLHTLRPGKMLEVGPGDGTFLLWMRARGWTVTGLDPDPQVVRSARDRGCAMVEGTVSSIPNERYDLIMAWHSLEHSVDPRRDIAILASRLSENGRIVIGVPDYGSVTAKFFGAYWFDLEVPRHRVHFTIGGLSRALADAGLSIVRKRHWLSSYTTFNSLKYKWYGRKTNAVETAAAMCLSPFCWLSENLGYADSLSIVAARKSDS